MPSGNTRTRAGVVEQLCSNQDCAVGWYPVAEFVSATGGSWRSRCRKCYNEYQRLYLSGGRPQTALAAAADMAAALRDLEAAWPEPMLRFDDPGTYDYDAMLWRPRRFDYDSAAPRQWDGDELSQVGLREDDSAV